MKTTNPVFLAVLISICSGMLGGIVSFALLKDNGFGVIKAKGIEIIDENGKVRSRLAAEGDVTLCFFSPDGAELLRLGAQKVRDSAYPVFQLNNSSGRSAFEIVALGKNVTMRFGGDQDTHLLLGEFPSLDDDVQRKFGGFEWGLAVQTGSLHSTGVGIIEGPDGRTTFVSPVSEHH